MTYQWYAAHGPVEAQPFGTEQQPRIQAINVIVIQYTIEKIIDERCWIVDRLESRRGKTHYA